MADLAPDPRAPVVTPAVARRPFSIGGRFARWEWVAFGGIALVYLAVVVLAVRRGPPLGWDESVYSLRARDFADGSTPRIYWNAFRAPGLPWLLHLLWGAGSHATVFRLVVAGFGLGLVAVTWLLTRHLFGPRAALVAAGGVALTPPLLLASTQVWPDVPGAATGLLAIALFVFATGGERPSWWMTALVPVAAAATFLRYGAPLPIMIGLVAMAVWRFRVLLRRPLPVIVTALAAAAAVAAVLLVPRLTGAVSSPFGAIAGFSRTAFSGFADYAQLAHQVVGPAAVVLALAGGVLAFGWAGGEGFDRGALVAVVAAGLATAVVLAVILHGEVRYLAPAYPWLWVAGAPGLVGLARVVPRVVRPVTIGVVVLVLAAAVVGLARQRNRDAGNQYATVRRAAEIIADEAAGNACLVVTGRVPQVMWYSGCDAALFDLKRVRLPAPRGRAVFMLLVGGFGDQPQGALLDGYRAAAGEPDFVIESGRGATIYLVGEPPAGG